ncbi:hypothetical protein DACRYDRAFT_34944, partial [Dacryopinax primogenitus]
MDTDFKCNSFKCRKPLPCDAEAKAIVTTCSRTDAVSCANELFRASQMCPACETSLTEPCACPQCSYQFPLKIIMCSLRPNNDYKTASQSVPNGSRSSDLTLLRAISFWNYQVSQENSYQQAMFKNANESLAQMQKHLDNVIREANGQIGLMQDKVSGLGRELDMERRRVFDLQEVSRERDKDYQKLK